MRSSRLRIAIVTLLAGLFIGQSSCNRYSLELFADVLAVAAVATLLAAHDEHHHSHHCGHRAVVYEGRYVYEYEGRWEYYDHDRGAWYYYEDIDVY